MRPATLRCAALSPTSPTFAQNQYESISKISLTLGKVDESFLKKVKQGKPFLMYRGQRL
jgi:hypothetical protein